MVLSFSWRGSRLGSEDHGLAVNTGYLRSLLCRQGPPPTEGERAYCRWVDRQAGVKGQMGCSANRALQSLLVGKRGAPPSTGRRRASHAGVAAADREICAEMFETSSGWGKHLIGF
jgi:hypothetical protein